MILLDRSSGFEKQTYAEYADILKPFNDMMQHGKELPTAKASGAASTADQPAKKGSNSIVTLSESSDPKYIAMQRGYVVDKAYCLKNAAGRIFNLQEFTASGCKLVEIIVPPVMSPPELPVPFGELKNWIAFKGNLPKMMPAPPASRGVGNDRIELEIVKCHVFQVVTGLAKAHVASEQCVGYQVNPQTLRCVKDIPKGALILAPFTESASKVIEKQTPITAAAKYHGNSYYIEQPTRATSPGQTEWP